MNNYLSKKVYRLFTPIVIVILSPLLWSWGPYFHHTNAQESQMLVLSLSRDFGYSSGTGNIQGTFSMKVTTDIDLQKVIFFIDDNAIGEDDQPPFQFQFQTDNFALGEHTMHALGYTYDGKEYASNEIHAIFVSEDEGWNAALKIIVPIFSLVLGALLISFAVPWIFHRGKPHRIILPERMGILGGAICPQCKLPLNIPFLKINLLVGALLPCPHCGKWSVVRRVSSHDFQAAIEAAKIQQYTDNSITQSEDQMNKAIDDSRYIDL